MIREVTLEDLKVLENQIDEIKARHKNAFDSPYMATQRLLRDTEYMDLNAKYERLRKEYTPPSPPTIKKGSAEKFEIDNAKAIEKIIDLSEELEKEVKKLLSIARHDNVRVCCQLDVKKAKVHIAHNALYIH